MPTKKQVNNENVNTNNIHINLNLDKNGVTDDVNPVKKTIATIIKTNKAISMGIGLFIGVITIVGIVQNFRTKNYTGKWHLNFKNITSTYIPYIGEVHSQEVYFTQNENNINGDGEKISYNGIPLPSSKHRKLEYTGIVDGKKLTARYVLHGEKRVSNGQMNVTISDDGNTLIGTFSGTAGNCAGSVTGERLED